MKKEVLVFLLAMLTSSMFADVQSLAPKYESSNGIQMKVNSNGGNVYLTFVGKDNNSCKYIVVETYYKIGSVVTTYTMIAESMNDNSLLGEQIDVSWMKSERSNTKSVPKALTVAYSVGDFRLYNDGEDGFFSKKNQSEIKIDFSPKTASSRKSWDHHLKVINPEARTIIKQAEEAQRNRSNVDSRTNSNSSRGSYSTISAGGSAGAYGSVNSSQGIDIKAAVEVKGFISLSIH